MQSEAINTAVRNHVCGLQTEEWQFSQLGQELYLFGQIFSDRFFGGRLSSPLLTIERVHRSRLGSYHIGRNGFGARNQITINSLHLRSKVDVLSVLLHELIHLWQHEITLRPGKPPYHNVQFQKKAEELGISVDKMGHQVGMSDPFLTVCREHGVDISAAVGVDTVAQRNPVSSSKLKKYSCRCTNVRVAVSHFRALCLNCNAPFVKQ